MKLLPIFLLAFFTLIECQPDFYAIFDFGVPKRIGVTEEELSLYTNLLDNTDSENYLRAKNINNVKAGPTDKPISYEHNVTNPSHSIIAVFDGAFVSRRMLNRLLLFDTFTYSMYTTDDMVGIDLVLFDRTRVYMNKIKDFSTVMALAINCESEGNITNATVFYMDSNNVTKGPTVTSVTSKPSLTKATSISIELYFENIYYLALSHKPINQSFFETWVGDFLKPEKQSVECSNCTKSRSCTNHASFVISTERMSKYSCVCDDQYHPYTDQEGNYNCIKLVSGEKCDVGCNNTCSEVDSYLCYENCSSNFIREEVNGNFVKCTIPMEIESAWPYVTLIVVPILVIGYIITAIILVRICKDSEPKPTARSFTSMGEVIIDTIPTSGHEKGIETDTDAEGNKGPMGTSDRMDTKEACVSKIEEEKVIEYRNPVKLKEKEADGKVHLGICKVCNGTNRELVVMFECGHLDVCKECVPKTNNCPTCSHNISA